MHTVRLLLKTTAYEEQILEKRFSIMWHIHNVMVKRAMYLLRKLEHDTVYQQLLEEYRTFLKKKKLSETEKAQKKVLFAQMKEIRMEMGLTEYGFQSYLKVCGKQFRKNISSTQVQKEATRVYKGVEKCLFGNGKRLHFKRFLDIDTIAGKNPTNGILFHEDTWEISWMGITIPCKKPQKEAEILYLEEALSQTISYCELKRMMFPNGWHYYVILYLKGDAPKKQVTATDGIMGIDIGTSSIAGVSDDTVILEELAPEYRKYNKKIQKLLQQMDQSKRQMNPNKYNEDGTINRKNHEKWKFSNTYRKKRRKLKTLYRQKSAYIKQSHEIMCNRLLEHALRFYVEDMSFQGLQRRAKQTVHSDKSSVITKKDGTKKTIYKYKRKKRFGRSLNNRAPAMFLNILERKAKLYGGCLEKIVTKEVKATQYDHVTGNYTKIPLKQRFKEVGGHIVQRDLYSAFLIRNAKTNLKEIDQRRCKKNFETYLSLQDALIKEMQQQQISMKQCFGF